MIKCDGPCFLVSLVLLSVAHGTGGLGPDALAGIQEKPGIAGGKERLSSDARISVLTIEPGSAVYTLFGHTALRIHDPRRQIDRVYNYGVFTAGPLFPLRFANGNLEYRLAVLPFESALRTYRQSARRVTEQVLRLPFSQRRQLFRYLEWKASPKRHTYEYAPFRDNCTTRAFEALKRAAGAEVNVDLQPLDHGRTYRQLVDPYLSGHPFIELGVDLLLGARADRPLSPEGALFLPRQLKRVLAGSTVRISEEKRPFVRRTQVLVVGETNLRPRKSRWLLGVGWGLFVAVLFLIAVLPGQRKRVGFGQALLRNGKNGSQYPKGGVEVRGSGLRRTRFFLDAILFGGAGLIGGTLLLLVFLSTHSMIAPNWNLVWAWPTHLWLALRLSGNPPSARIRTYLRITAFASLLITFAWCWGRQQFPLPLRPYVLAIGAWAWVRSLSSK